MASNDLFKVDDNTFYGIRLSISTLKYCLFISNNYLSITIFYDPSVNPDDSA